MSRIGGVSGVPGGYVLLQRANGEASLAACLDGGRFHGWLFAKGPEEGQWVSVRKLAEWEVMQAEDQRDDSIVQETNGAGGDLEIPVGQAKPVAIYSGIDLTRYTIEWTNGQLPVGAKLYAAPVAKEAPKAQVETRPFRQAISAIQAVECPYSEANNGTNWHVSAHAWDMAMIEAIRAVNRIVDGASVAKEAPAVPEGCALVPLKLTEEMHVAAVRAIIKATGNDDFPPAVWSAMIAAAPVASVAVDATREAEQPIIGKLLDQMTQLQMLFPDGCQEPGALVRFSEVTKVLVNASKQQANVLPPTRGTDSQHDADLAVLLAAVDVIQHDITSFLRSGDTNTLELARTMALATMEDIYAARRFRAQGGNTSAESSDRATTTSTVSAPAEHTEGDFARLSRAELIDYINLLRNALDSVNFPAPSSTVSAPNVQADALPAIRYEHAQGFADATHVEFAQGSEKGYGVLFDGGRGRVAYSRDEAASFVLGGHWKVCVEGAQKAPEEVREPVLRLLNHIEDAVDDANWEKISPALWNAVTSHPALRTSSTDTLKGGAA